MGFFTEWIAIVKKYHRHVLLGILGLLFVLDIITTTVALQQGSSEQNSFMIPLVQDPVLHLVIKIIIYVCLYFTVERAYQILIKRGTREKKSSFEKMCFQIIYALVLLSLMYLISFYLIVIVNNTLVISS